MKHAATFLALALSALAFAAPARRYSYSGSDPSAWTKTTIEAAASTGAASGYTTYIGDGNEYRLAAIKTDVSGNTYVAGIRLFADPSPAWLGSQIPDIFVTKLDASGALVFTATFSGKGIDTASGLAVDQAGNIYLAGSTSSPNFPLRNALLTQPSEGFLVKLSPDGSRLVYSTYFWSAISAIAVDQDQNVYLTGSTRNPNFPHTPGMPADAAWSAGPRYRSGAFFTKISAAGDRLVYSGVIAGGALTCAGGSSCILAPKSTEAHAIALDAAGNAYVAGSTNTTDLPTSANAFRKTGIGAFVGKVNAAGTGLGYLTYLGPRELAPWDVGKIGVSGLAPDAAGNVVIVGVTTDPSFQATPGAYQTSLSDPSPESPYFDAFAAKLNTDGSNVVWATFLGGIYSDMAGSIALDRSGNVWISGTTQSPDFPNADGWSQGGDFLAELNPSGSALLYSARFPDGSVTQGLALDPSGLIHFAGPEGIVSAFAPGEAFSTRVAGLVNIAGGFPTGLVAPGEVISIYGPQIGPSTPVNAAVDSAGLLPKSLAGVQVLFDGVAAPLLFVSSTQINAVVPFALNGKTSARLQLSRNDVSAPDFPLAVVSTQPRIFMSANGIAAAMNEDGSLNSAEHPARPGSIVTIWATGTGFIAARDGEIATSAQDSTCCTLLQDLDTSFEVVYAGAAPGLVAGITQINFRVPSQPSFSFQLVAGGRVSDAASIYVAQ